MKWEVKKYKNFSRRAFLLGSIKLLLLSVACGRYFQLQVLKWQDYDNMSQKNRLRSVITPAQRGDILDRNLKPIAINKQNFKIALDPIIADDPWALIIKLNKYLTKKIELSQAELHKKIRSRSNGDYIYIQDDTTWQDANILLENQHLLPSIELVISNRRTYLFSEKFAHITGYVSLPTKAEIAKLDLPASSQIKIGKSGLEKMQNEILFGEIGFKRHEVDSKGNIIKSMIDIEPKQGGNIISSIDSALQNYIYDVISEQGLKASVIVLDIHTGQILAMVSQPSYDPNKFLDGVSQEYWDYITSDDAYPLINTAISSPYPPGSTFKLATALAALESGIDPNEKIFCTGQFIKGNRVFHCNKRSGHGWVDTKKAIAESCNTYFFHTSLKMGIDKLENIARSLNIGAKTGIGLPSEAQGLMPSQSWKRKKYNISWYPGDTINTSIGQGYVLMTPLQITLMTARIASGLKITPSILFSSSSPDFESLGYKLSNIHEVKRGMFACANEPGGTLLRHNMSLPNFEVCGKTGTSQVVSLTKKQAGKKHEDHALCTAFAPFENSRYAVTAVVEHGKGGSLAAAPIVKLVMHYLYRTL